MPESSGRMAERRPRSHPLHSVDTNAHEARMRTHPTTSSTLHRQGSAFNFNGRGPTLGAEKLNAEKKRSAGGQWKGAW